MDFRRERSILILDKLPTVQIVGKNGAAPPPNFALVLSLGCLAQDAQGRWILDGATSPVRSTMPDQATPEEIQADRTRPFGFYQFRLADFGYLGNNFDPQHYEGHKIQVTVLEHTPEKVRSKLEPHEDLIRQLRRR